eukprot:Trichotokara_eunicae@DN6031_c0_g1_i3.p1
MLLDGKTLDQLIFKIGEGLEDQLAEVRSVARNSLSALVASLSDETCEGLSSRFLTKAGKANVPMTDTGRIAGIFGLAALINSCAHHVPQWLPNTITNFAKYGSTRTQPNVYKEVEKTLQEFFRSHQDAWEREHKEKFTEDQLDLLYQHKGLPRYFS